MDGQVIIGNWNDNILCEKWNLFIKYKYYMWIKWRINNFWFLLNIYYLILSKYILYLYNLIKIYLFKKNLSLFWIKFNI